MAKKSPHPATLADLGALVDSGKAKPLKASKSLRKLARAEPSIRPTLKPQRKLKADSGDILSGSTVSQRERARAIRVQMDTENAADRRRNQPTLKEAISDELSGRGHGDDVVRGVAKKVGKALVPSGTSTIKYRGKLHKVEADTAGVPGLGKIGGRGQRLVEDLVNIPAQAIPSLYVTGAAAYEAAKGDTSRGAKLLKDLPHTSPTAALVTGHPGRALKIADEHPGFALAEAYGVKGAVGRTAGRAARSGVLGGELKKVASTKREDAVGPEGTGLAKKREYSRDLTVKAGQVLREKRKIARAEELHRRAKETGDAELAANANRIDPRIMSDSDIRRRMDAQRAAAEAIRRHNRATIVRETERTVTNQAKVEGSPAKMAATLKRNRSEKIKPTAAATLHAQGITKASHADLRAYRAEIVAQQPNLSPSKLRANRETVKQIDKALKKPDVGDKLTNVAERYAEIMGPLQEGLIKRGMLAEAQAAKAPLIPYAVRHMGATYDKKAGVFTNKAGDIVTTSDIRAHMKANGVKPPAFVTQAPGMRGAKNFFLSSSRAPNIGNKGPRTGLATKEGTHDVSPRVLVEGAARAQGLIDAADGFTAMVKEFAHKPTLGKLKTHRDAESAARDLEARTGTSWAAIRVSPFKGRHEQLSILLEKAQEGSLGEIVGGKQPLREAIESAVRGEDGPGDWALIPQAAQQQLAAHMRTLGAGPKAKAFQVVSSNFRRTVLATSPSWALGNLTEGLLRMGISRSGPMSYATGRAALARLKEIDPDAAHELAVRTVGGGHYHSAEGQHIHRDSTQFADSAVLAPVAKALGAFWRAPGPKHAANAWRGWTDIVFRQLNGRLESGMQTAMLGRALRESPLMSDHTRKLGAEAIDQAARGLRDTNEQARFADAVRRMYGQYDAFSPDTRWAIATYTPFVAWTLNAIKFMTDVLPRDHPALLALIAASEEVTADWRKDHGMDLFIKDRLPGFLQGSIPLSEGRHQRAPFRYTPFGAFGDLPTTLAGAVLPQASGVLSAFKGEDWKGKKLRNKDGSQYNDAQKAIAAAGSFIDSTVPIVGVAKRVAQRGPSALNPLRPVAPPKDKSAGSSGSTLKDLQGVGSGSSGTSRDLQKLSSGGGGSTEDDLRALIGG